MILEIITPEKQVYEGPVNAVQMPGSKGSFAVLKNHAPIISTLERGMVKIETKDNKELHFYISGGLVEVKDNKVILLAEKMLEQ